MTSTPVPRTGSIKDKVVAPDLLEERKKCNYDQAELSAYLWGGPAEQERVRGFYRDMESHPDTVFTEKFYDMTREEQIEDGLKRFRAYYDLYSEKYVAKFKRHYIPFWSFTHKGLVSIRLSNSGHPRY